MGTEQMTESKAIVAQGTSACGLSMVTLRNVGIRKVASQVYAVTLVCSVAKVTLARAVSLALLIGQQLFKASSTINGGHLRSSCRYYEYRILTVVSLLRRRT